MLMLKQYEFIYSVEQKGYFEKWKSNKESHRCLKRHKREYLPVNDASIFVFGQTITLTCLNFADVVEMGFSSNVCAINSFLTNSLS